MASTITPTNLSVRITDTMTLNNQKLGGSYTINFSGITNAYQRILPVSNVDQTVLYTTDASVITGSQLDKDLIKYARITNLDDYSSINIIITNDDNDEVGILIPPKGTLPLFSHDAAMNVAHAGVFTETDAVAASAAQAVSAGTSANGMTEGQYVQIISYDASGNTTTKNYVISDTNAGGVATGTVLESGTDIGSNTFGSLVSAVTEGVAVGINKSSANQYTFLVQLKAAIEHVNGHNGKITCGTVSGPSGGADAFTMTQAKLGAGGNTVTTEDIANFTSADFTGGVDGTIPGLNFIKEVSAIGCADNVDVEVFVASS
jgi:hypothetical protein